ncbi:MAG: hypothetical protein A2231_13075 [Candidatus Firestonebacteria bacterium RIFOXYA2_FULL_40_8]|nr:MAG: hypothetical protein A2231_13075 [Candidatus Firestonebacteria bacterium RIFOXYA2_FULL_40_8]
MENRSHTFKIVLFLMLFKCLAIAAEENIFAYNPFLELKSKEFRYIEVVQGVNADVWLILNRELYKYSIDGLKLFASEDAGVTHIWSYDTIYTQCKRGGIYSLEIVDNGKLKLIEESSFDFNFYKTAKGDKIQINTKGEIKINGAIVEKLDLSRCPGNILDVDALLFSEECPGSVWFWFKYPNIQRDVCGSFIYHIDNGKVYKLLYAPEDSHRYVTDIVEPEAGVIYVGEDSKSRRISYKIIEDRIIVDKLQLLQKPEDIKNTLHFRAKNGRLWAISTQGNKEKSDLFYYENGAFVKYAEGLDVNFYNAGKYFMLEENGYILTATGLGYGVAIVAPDKINRNYGIDQGINLGKTSKILKLPDGDILLVNINALGYTIKAEKAFQLLRKDSVNILNYMVIQDKYERFSSRGGIKADSKGNYYWEDEDRILYKFDGKIVLRLYNAKEFAKANFTDKEYFIKSFGIDTEDHVWMVFYDGQKSEFAVVMNSNGSFEKEELVKMYGKKCEKILNFTVKFLDKTIQMAFCPPNVVLKQDDIVDGCCGKQYPTFKTASAYKLNRNTGAYTVISSQKLDKNEDFLSGFSKTPEGRLYLTTYKYNSEKDCYVLENNTWKISEIFYPNKEFEALTNNKSSIDLKSIFGKHNVTEVAECGQDIIVFKMRTHGVFLRNAGKYYRFKNIPGPYYGGVDNMTAFIDVYENLYISISNGRRIQWIRIKKEDMCNVTEEINIAELMPAESANTSGSVSSAGKRRLEKKVLKGKFGSRVPDENSEGLLTIKEAMTGDKIAAVNFKAIKAEIPQSITNNKVAEVKFEEKKAEKPDLEGNFKKLISVDQKEVLEAERFFTDNGSEAKKFLEEKLAGVTDENIVWKIEAILSRVR